MFAAEKAHCVVDGSWWYQAACMDDPLLPAPNTPIVFASWKNINVYISECVWVDLLLVKCWRICGKGNQDFLLLYNLNCSFFHLSKSFAIFLNLLLDVYLAFFSIKTVNCIYYTLKQFKVNPLYHKSSKK